LTDVRRTIIAGFAAFQNHLSYLPFSGSILPQLADELEGYTMAQSALHFPIDRPLAKTLIEKLIAARLAEVSRARISVAELTQRPRQRVGGCRRRAFSARRASHG
jgi:uncharacterized protein YdhG (YjbR/CyaY superfamily)